MQNLTVSLLACAILAAAPAAAQSSSDTQLAAAETALEHADYPAAIAALKPLAAAQPHNPHILYDLGFAQERVNDDTAAAAAYRAAIAADPSMAQPQLALGLLDARNGHFDSAHRELSAVSNLVGASSDLRARALRSLAVLDEHANPDTARDELLAALKLSPETPADILLSARLADHAGAFPDAEAAYRRYLAVHPHDPGATAGLAHTLTAQGKTADAEALLTTALKQSPADPQILSELVAVYGAEGKPGEAIPLVEKLRASDPASASNPALTRLLAHLYSLSGDYAKADPLLRQLIAENPKDPLLLDDLASALVASTARSPAAVQQQKFTEAQTLLAKSVAMRASFPSDAEWGEAEGHLAFAASRNHDPRLTLQALAARATVLPNSPASLFLEATAHDTLHQNKDAERAYRAFLSLASGKYPDQEFQARHRLIALERER